MQRTDLGRGAWIAYDPGFLPPPDADRLFEALRGGITWEERPIVIFGREILQPRLIGWAGELPYRYSGQVLEPRTSTPAVDEVRARVEEAAGAAFNHVLLNLYRDGRDHVAFHADAERELGRDPLIASISLGAPREFVLKAKKKSRWKRIRLAHGSLLLMGGTLQHGWRHALPRAAGLTEPRINVTLRRLYGPPGG